MKTTTEKIYWNSPGDVLAITNGQTAPRPPLIPEGMRSLTGQGAVERTVNVLMMFRDEHGTPMGMGSELEILPDADGQPLQVYFTVMLVNRGTLFVHELKDY